MLPWALLSLLSVVLAVPLKQGRRSLQKPDCPAGPLVPVDQDIAFLPASFKTNSFLASSVISDVAQEIEPLLDPISSCSVLIPVQFNNFYLADSTAREDGYITDDQFAQALARLNSNYAVFSSIRFELQAINRIPLSVDAWADLEVTSADADMHQQIGMMIKGSNVAQSETRIMHVNLVRDADACGFTYLPVASWSQVALIRDAVTLDTKCFDGSAQFRSTTFTHEAGHWLGLFHTFEGGCTGEGDYVADTPPAVAPSDDPESLYDNCNLPGSTSSCGSTNTTEISMSLSNYMSYSINECRTQFTPGQVERMDAVLSATRGYTSC